MTDRIIFFLNTIWRRFIGYKRKPIYWFLNYIPIASQVQSYSSWSHVQTKVVRVIRSLFYFGIQGGSFLEYEAFCFCSGKQKVNLDNVHFLVFPTPITAPATAVLLGLFKEIQVCWTWFYDVMDSKVVIIIWLLLLTM